MADPFESDNQIPQQDPPFYNVMPKVKNLGDVLQASNDAPPTVSSTTAATGALAEQSLANSLPARWSRVRIFIVLFVLLVVLGAGGYFTHTIFFQKDDEPQSAEVNSEQTEATQPEGVTTPNEWQLQYFGAGICTEVDTCGDDADPDRDGLTNLQEYNKQTDPYNPDTDGDGLADGDEVAVFGGSPTSQRTANNTQFTDGDDARGGFDSTTGQKMTDTQLTEVKRRMSEFGLHQPTPQTLGEFATSRYNFGVQSNLDAKNATLPAGVDSSEQAMLNRDTQRLATIKKVGTALLAYKADKKAYPAVSTFNEMTAAIKPYVQVATNYTDPVNVAPFIYNYTPSTDNQDFTLRYYSETQKQTVRYTQTDAQKDNGKQSANLNNEQRMNDLENLRAALLYYSAAYAPQDGVYVFPAANSYKTELAPNYIAEIPKDPSGKDYVYTVSAGRNTFKLETPAENPTAGATKIVCSELQECQLQ